MKLAKYIESDASQSYSPTVRPGTGLVYAAMAFIPCSAYSALAFARKLKPDGKIGFKNANHVVAAVENLPYNLVRVTPLTRS